MKKAGIDTEALSARLRARMILPQERKILITRLTGSRQEEDITTPVNCSGYGRIHHFHLSKDEHWSVNPLPLVPAAHALGYTPSDALRVQVFQNAGCNWRCWYCYVDYKLLSANYEVSEYLSAEDLLEMYLDEIDRPDVIDLSGGQPELTPEWVLWMMEALEDLGLRNNVYLWSDDNLSNDYFWRYLSEGQRNYIASYPNYARVACFKGYDEESFAFNTNARPDLFDYQFNIYKALLEEGLDMYAYVTFTSLPSQDLETAIETFVDRLQRIHINLPLRTVPLRIEPFSPVIPRVTDEREQSLKYQFEVHEVWQNELNRRFTYEQRTTPVNEILLNP